jgi:hypothetical protein
MYISTSGELCITDTFPDVNNDMEPKEFTWTSGELPEAFYEVSTRDELESLAVEWAFENLAMNELHEVAEFFSVGGKRIYDPHATLAPHVAFRFGSGRSVPFSPVPA